MTVHLPIAFVERMKYWLGDEFPEFHASYHCSRSYGLRINTLKIAVERFVKLSPFDLEPIPWAPEGFYYEGEERPGKHPYYHAGLYYIQEPSAMAPVQLLDVKPGDRVLDLCAAPGGKSVQIAAKLQNDGLLVCNDNHAVRVKALVKNIELSGVRNAAVFNETPAVLAKAFPGFFDKILVDAPCSGEGMFRKEEEMAHSWDNHSVEKYSAMQRDILHEAAAMLVPGGTMVYSTCTFAPEENERMIAWFLDNHPHFEVVPGPASGSFAPGRTEWLHESPGGASRYSEKAERAVAHTVRLWPHLIRGEGHYAAILRHTDTVAVGADIVVGVDNAGNGRAPRGKRETAHHELRREEAFDKEPFQQFMKDCLIRPLEGKFIAFGSYLYLASNLLPELSGLNVARPGWFLGMMKKNRFEPSHALAMGLRKEDAARTIPLASDAPSVIRYLKGETLEIDPSDVRRHHESTPLKGYCLVTIDGFALGWGKWQDGMLKNEYPSGWRWI